MTYKEYSRKITKQILKAVIVLSLLLFIGSLGFMTIEGMGIVDSLYMTVITLSTVGFGEVKPLSQIGKIYTVFLILAGVGSATYLLSNIFQSLLEGEFRYFLGRRIYRAMKRIKGHYIVCGCGRIGFLVAYELMKAGKQVIVIDRKRNVESKLEKYNIPFVLGDATEETTLIEAGIERANGLITTLPGDVDNVFTILTARELRKDIFILARAIDEASEKKLKRAGATKVIKPYLLGGIRMAQAILRPHVIDFIDIATLGDIDLLMEEIKVNKSMEFFNKTIKECQFRQKYGIMIVAIRKGDGSFIFNPSANEKIEENDTLIVLGNKKDLQKLGF
jgi:voltage-gated potassium channel